MHPEILILIIEHCRQRVAGDGTYLPPYYSVEQLENAVVQLTERLEMLASDSVVKAQVIGRWSIDYERLKESLAVGGGA